MASPQLENGYTRIANELYEALIKFDMPREVYKVVHTIIRKTYGFGKKEDIISLSQFCSLTGLQKRNVIRGIHKAILIGIVLRRENGYIWKYRLNKDFNTWRSFSVGTQGVSVGRMGGVRRENKSFSVGTHTKESKETIQKKIPASREKTMNLEPDDVDSVIDLDTGLEESVEEQKRIKQKGYNPKDTNILLGWGIMKLGRKFNKPLKQKKHIADMLAAGCTPEMIKEKWEELEDDKFWGEKGVDFSIVASQIDKAHAVTKPNPLLYVRHK